MQVQHLSSSKRLVFGFAPLLRVAKRLRHAASFSLADLIERLQVLQRPSRQTARVGTQALEEAITPVAILSGPTGYFLRVAGAMEC